MPAGTTARRLPSRRWEVLVSLILEIVLAIILSNYEFLNRKRYDELF